MSNKRKNTSGRKYISFKPYIKHRGELVSVNSQGSGIYTHQTKQAFEQFDRGVDRWRRMLVINFQLKPPEYAQSDNSIMSQLRNTLSYFLKVEYNISTIGYTWCRELEKGKGPHYHFMIWVDGNKVRTPNKINRKVCEIWEAKGGFFWSLRKYFIYVDSDEARKDALYWLSYLCKGRGKGYKPAQIKDYSTSRLLQVKRKNEGY